MQSYDITDKSSIEKFAKLLIWKKLREFLPQDFLENKWKWYFGNLLEEYYFWYKPNSHSQADFPSAWVELKSTPVIRKGKWWIRSKERLVLNIINYKDIISETWQNSSFQKKNSLILLILYLYEKNLLPIDYIICMVEYFQFSASKYDLLIIKNDWEIIVDKIRDGKAHELSEWDTMYLWACTKGATAETSYRDQPNSPIKAKQRAFSFKQGYMNSVLERFSWNDIRYKSLFDISAVVEKSFEENLLELFSPYIGKSAFEIGIQLNIKSKAKSYYHLLSSKILWVESDENIEEFQKANIQMKTIRLKPNGIPKEDISFPAFQFNEIVNQNWEESDLYNLLEQKKFLFVMYKMDVKNDSDFNKMSPEEQKRHLILYKVTLWNAPAVDIDQKAQITWNLTQKIIKKWVVIYDENWITHNNLPSKSQTNMIHIRPHGRNKEDTFELPDWRRLTKQCFWFNNDYIAKQLWTNR